MLIVHLPDNSEFFYSHYHCRPELGKNLSICYNIECNQKSELRICNCKHCYKCCNSIVVEKTEDDKEIWVEFIKKVEEE